MREPFPLSGWLIIGLLIVVAVFLLAGPHSRATSNSFTLTEIRSPGRWQYRAVANSAPGGFSRWQDSPWHWRHYGGPVWAGEDNINCDDTFALFPADPTSPDTAVSADGGTVTVNIYQEIDTVWICFAFECDDGSHSFALMRNSQTETTITSGACIDDPSNRINRPDNPSLDTTETDNDELDTVDDVDPIDDPNGQGEEGPNDNDQSDQNQDGGDQGNNGQGGGNQEGEDNQPNDQGQSDQDPDGQSGNDQNSQDSQTSQQQPSTDLIGQPSSK